MANKVFKQSFAKDFTGIDGLSASIETDADGVNRAVNLEYAVSNSLRGRLGCQFAGGYPLEGNSQGFSAIHSYSYTRTQNEYDIKYQIPSGNYGLGTTVASLSSTVTSADGSSISKLVARNGQLWVRDILNVTLTAVGATYPITWYTTVSNGAIHFIIKDAGVTILDYDCETGIDEVGGYSNTIYAFLVALNATPKLSITIDRSTCPPFAITSGILPAFIANRTYGTEYQITVNAGHTFVAGDIISSSYASEASIVVSTTATTINYIGSGNLLSANGAIIGYLGQQPTSFEVGPVNSVSSGNVTLSIPYWRSILESDALNGIGYLFYGTQYAWIGLYSSYETNSFWIPPNSVNATGNLYMASASTQNWGTVTAWNTVYKTDGQQVYLAGLPKPSITVTAIAGGALPVGTYKYKVFLRRVDAQGNIIESEPSNVVNGVSAGGNNQMTVVPSMSAYGAGSGYQTRSAFKNTAENTSGFFYVDDNIQPNALLQIGDPICFMDNTSVIAGITGVGVIRRSRITDYCPQLAVISPTASSIRIAAADRSAAYTIANNSPISTGLTYVVLRTALGGNTFYKLAEIPAEGYTNSYSFTDNVLDTVLTAQEQYIEVPIGKEHNPPPSCSLICEHQGGLVVARGFGQPNTVSFSSADGIEYFPTASNSFDIPSTQQGYITAIASDTADRLAVFKNRAYYDVVGDLDSGSFSINIANQGDYGISSHMSIKRVNNTLIGVGEKGFVTVSNGQLDPLFFKELNTRLINQPWAFNLAQAENDLTTQKYICSIPVDFYNSAPKTYVIDYSRGGIHTFEYEYANKVDPGAGICLVNDELFHLSRRAGFAVFKRLPRFDGNSPTGNDGDSYIDNTSAINYVLESNAINFGEPGQLKTPIRVRLWSLPNDYVEDGWITHSTLVETACSAIASYIGGVTPGSASSTLTFATANDAFKDVKLPNYKTHFYLIRLTTNAIRTAPFWTGYEIMFVENYDKEDFVK